MGARPPQPDAEADWDQRRMQADHDLERSLEQERLRQARAPRALSLSQPHAGAVLLSIREGA